VRFIQAYAANGLPVVAVTPQNEMNYGPAAYPGMVWTPAEEAAFISSALGPALRRAGLDTRILVWDHNWDRADLAAAILADPGAAAHASGVAWHWYGGSPVAMASLLERFPGSEAWFTEGGSGRWIGGGSFHGQFRDGICQAVAIFANGSKSLVWWNLALDQRNGPVVYPNTDNHGLVEIDTATGSLASPCRAGYYALGHFSRFVRPGAARIAVDDAGSGLRAVAFRNPDGGLVLVAANPCLSAQAGRAVLDGRAWDFEVPGEGAVSLVLRP
jgi:glucosylceramidase